jgi:gas vesicle protein
MSAGKIFAGVVLGAAVGTVVGMLLAPAKGSVTQKKIVQYGTDRIDNAKEKLDVYVGSIAEEINTLKESTIDLAGKGKALAASVGKLKHS